MSWAGPCVVCGAQFNDGNHQCQPAALAKIEREQQIEAERVESEALTHEPTDFVERLEDGLLMLNLTRAA